MPYASPSRRIEYDRQRAESRREYFRRRYQTNVRNTYNYKYSPRTNGIGAKGEVLAQSLLEGAIKIIHPCDISWEGKLVDVKTSTKLKNTKCSTYKWKFFLRQIRKVDLFFIICLGLDKKVEHIFLIPDKDIKVNNLTISEKRILQYSKYRLSLYNRLAM